VEGGHTPLPGAFWPAQFSGTIEDIGLSGVPTLAVDGWSDGGYSNLQFCRWLALQSLGADARCIRGQHGHSYQPYEELEEFQ
jgi:hypothetical protein